MRAGRPILATLVVEDASKLVELSEAVAAQEDEEVLPEAKKSSARGADDSARAHLATDPDWCRKVLSLNWASRCSRSQPCRFPPKTSISLTTPTLLDIF